jgi:hypothetical protein
MNSPNNRNRAIATAGAGCWTAVVVAARAFHYCCAATRDERNRFPYAAAAEWRQSAELFATGTSAAEYCWRQWERIMQVPRRLAGPIGDSSRVTFVAKRVSTTQAALQPVVEQISITTVA